MFVPVCSLSILGTDRYEVEPHRYPLPSFSVWQARRRITKVGYGEPRDMLYGLL
jgi:hypothetical protein